MAAVFGNLDLSGLAECTFGRWQPAIGDPTVMGWVTVGAYLATFALSLAVFRRSHPSRRAMRLFWAALVLMMLFLAINKQLDLQSFATAAARCVAKMQGWYEQRRAFQIKVVLAMAAAAVLLGGFFFWQLRHDLGRNLVALIGMTFVFGFVLVRAVGWHDFDALIDARIARVRLNWVLELSGLVLISANAALLLRSRRIMRARRRRRVGGQARYARPRRRRRAEPDASAFRRDHGCDQDRSGPAG